MAATAKRARRTRLDEDEGEEEELVDRISRLPDGILGDIVSLLPTKDGGRTQVLSSRWRRIWRSAPLNLGPDPYPARVAGECFNSSDIWRILSAHQGPGRRFCAERIDGGERFAASLDQWLRSPALDKLQELYFHHRIPSHPWGPPPPPQPASVDRFSSTLRVASFGDCCFPDGKDGALHLPVLEQLSLLDVTLSESSLNALLAGCPVLQSLLLSHIEGCSRVRIVSHTLRSIGVFPGHVNNQLQELIIKDAPSLERLLHFDMGYSKKMDISVISAPKLHVLALLPAHDIMLQFGTTYFHFGRTHRLERHVSLMTVAQSMTVLAFTEIHLSLDAVINLIKCFPSLEKLYIKTKKAGDKNVWCHTYKNLIGTFEIRLKKIVLRNYRGNTSHVNFAKFFILNATMLESMRLELLDRNPSSAWIERQHRLLRIKNKVSRDLLLDFVPNNSCCFSSSLIRAEQVHDLSTADPFVRFHDWT